MQTQQDVKLDQSLLDFIQLWKDKKGKEIMILHKVQEVYGYVPRAVAMEVSRLIDMPLAKIYGIITFYHLFKLTKPGRHRISVCLGTACYLKGGNDIIGELENILGIGVNAVTDDGSFSVEIVRCVGCCGLAPVLLVDGKAFGNLKKEDLPKILSEYSQTTQ
ncbi:MAG: NAD(P)H-dependent oxidoreductase subunit E [bacterium]